MKVRILAIASAALLIASCGVADKAGAAAVVGGNVIAESTVTEQVNQARTDLENTSLDLLQNIPTMSLLSQMVIDRLVLEEILKYAVADLEISISDSDVANYRDTVFRNYGEAEVKAQLVSQNGLAQKYVDNFMYDIMVQREIMDVLAPGMNEQIQAAALYKYLSGIAKDKEVEVSPRYGVWDPETMRTTLVDNFLSTTTPAEVTQ